ncbi:MarR family winged helix-turn-helix transcriptional regulator [Collinsella tanakaei]|uniref:MarR family winged helix-turn-helix transcriptional regulator n=1 Tax=Collinsella tanakaei TaxID=626935 RepID=UPI001958E5CD|nr:MarR family transcriptional regulator [Collinsella tanakaei]MBM6867340.1 MarR family transcriptional regulator [Collinsella tanakaei]
MEQSRFEDFVGLVTLISKEISRIKTVEAAKLGLRGSDIMCLYYLGQNEEGLTGAELARESDVTRAAVSRTLAHLEEDGFVEVCGEQATGSRYRAPVRLTEKGRQVNAEANEIIRRVVTEVGEELGDIQRVQMYRSLNLILERLRGISRE